MSDKIRGALFNVLGDIEDLTVLDAFAGTGALSFEAVSRGARRALALESDRPAQRTISQNIQTLGLQQTVQLVAASANAWLQTNPDAHFDLVLCDPPYDDLQPSLLMRLSEHITASGIFVLSWPADADLPDLSLRLLEHKKYGDATLAFYGN